MWAAWAGNTDAVRALLEKGAGTRFKNSQGTTALMLASEKPHREVVAMLEEERDSR